MDSSFFHSPTQNSEFSSESSFESLDSFSWDGLNLNPPNFLPFNENDSEEMLLFGLLSNSNDQVTSETFLKQVKEEEVS